MFRGEFEHTILDYAYYKVGIPVMWIEYIQ